MRAGARDGGGGNARAASLRLSRRAEAVAAGPRGLAVGGERNAGARRAPPPPDKCFFFLCQGRGCPRAPNARTVQGMRAAAAAVPGGEAERR